MNGKTERRVDTMGRRRNNLNGAIRRTVRESDRSTAAVSRAVRIDEGLLPRLLADRKDPSVAGLEERVEVLEPEIVARQKRGPRGR